MSNTPSIVKATFLFTVLGLVAGFLSILDIRWLSWLPLGVLPALLTGVAVFIGAKVVFEWGNSQALLLAALAAAGFLVGIWALALLASSVARQRSLGSGLLLGAVVGLAPVAVLLLASYRFRAFRERSVWLPVLIVNVGIMLWFFTFLENSLGGSLTRDWLFMLGTTLMASSIGYALAVKEN